jgi:hypothetical protein
MQEVEMRSPVSRLRRRSFVAAVLSLSVLAGCRAAPTSPVVLDVPGRTDATPWVAASGSVVAVAWGATAGGKTDVFLAVSLDGGQTFRAPVQVNTVDGEARLGGEFPPRVALRTGRADSVPEIVVLWTAQGDTTAIKTATSRDGGRTFGAAITLQAAGAPGNRGWPAVAFDDQGIVHAIWLDHRGLAAKGAGDAHHGSTHDGVAMAQKSGLYYAAVNGTRPGEWELTRGVCYCCKTALAAGPNRTLFAAWRHVYPGDLRDMALTVSHDGGRSFAPPSRVSEDGWAITGCPDDGPSLAVDGSGTAHLAWPTVIDARAPEGAIFYASTRDGVHVTPRVRVPTFGGPRPTHPQITADAQGRIFVAWEEILDGQRLAGVREVMPHTDGSATFGDIVTLARGDSALYPALAATDQGIIAVWATGGAESRIGVRTLH